ncbi:MAG: type I-E CRISPR-associated protein Cas7/Cse4/CasC [Pyrinomonadaceae bacterium]
MFIELHIIQNFAPSNLNRSDTGSPKDCEFGGVRRARISSQCFKRAIRRDSGFFNDFIERSGGGVRTRRLIIEIAKRISSQDPAPEKTVKLVAEVFNEGGIERPKAKKGEEAEKDNTKLILYMDNQAIDKMAAQFKDNWEDLNGKNKEIREQTIARLGEILAQSVNVPDIALFGRMVEIEGSKPFGKLQLGVDAACQVAQSISTHKSGVEFDFYTAVDDLLPTGETGAGMMGTVEFNSACFYRYANVDMEQLKKNLNGDEALATETLEAFIRAAVHAVPTAKQNSMAAQNPPSFVLAVASDARRWSLANAFEAPVRPSAMSGLVESSIKKLDDYWQQLTTAFGDGQIADKCYVNLSGKDLEHLNGSRVASVDVLVKKMREAVKFKGTGAGKES